MTMAVDLADRQRAVLPSWLTTYYDDPLEFAYAEGSRVTDTGGRTYLDAFGGIVTTSLGYAVAEVREAVDRQLATGVVHSSTLYLIRNQVELAERIAATSRIPDARVFFTNSGTEANDTALLLACAHTGSDNLLALCGSYHGRSIATLAVTELRRWKPVRTSPFQVVFASNGIPDRPVEDCVLEVRAQLSTQSVNRLAALIVEPVQGVNGFRRPPDGLIAAYHELVLGRGGLLISDEVQSGWGRTGRTFWGIEQHGVVADMLTFAKGIGNGFAIGGVVASAAVMDAITTNSISTFGGNPMSTAAALATLDLIESRDLQHHAEVLGTRIVKRLRESLASVPCVTEIRGFGLLIAVEFGDPKAGHPDAKAARRVQSLCRDEGVLVGLGGGAGNVLRLSPPMTLTTTDADTITDAVAQATRTYLSEDT